MKITMKILSLFLITPSLLVAQEQSPNIIVFLVDDMGVMDNSVPFLVGSDGEPVVHPLNEWYRTPNMEQLASQGVRFSTFYAQSVSSPSRASLLTGQNATRHGTTNWISGAQNNRTKYGPSLWNWSGLTKSDVTLPKVLRGAGYKTIHVGKAHFGPQGSEGEDPRNIGFDVNIGGSAIGHPGSYYGESGYGKIKGQRGWAVPDLDKYHGTDTFLTDALTIEAKNEISKSVSDDKPFFLHMSHYAVHAPFEVDKRYIQNYQNRGKSGGAVAFATLIEGMDRSLGDIMKHLDSLGIAEQTLIVFMGDNGSDSPLGRLDECASSAPLRGKKGTEFEGGTRIPFIVSWARGDSDVQCQKETKIAQGAIQTQMGTVMDIFPTLLSVADVDTPEGHIIDGYDMRKQLSGKRDKKRGTDFLMHFPHQHNCSYFTTYVDGDWKVIYEYNPETPETPSYRLFNLELDPSESNDLSDIYAEKLREMVLSMSVKLRDEGALYPVDKAKRALEPIVP